MSAGGRGAVLARAAGLGGLSWGAALLTRGPQLWGAVESRPPGAVEELVTQVLGVRHAAQGLAQLVAPRASSRVAVVVDVLHAATMGCLAVASPPRRRAALLSGGVSVVSASVTAASRRRGDSAGSGASRVVRGCSPAQGALRP